MPPKKLRGTEITSAQGQEMTRKVRARWSQSVQTVPARNPGRVRQHRQQDRRDQEQSQRRIHHTGGIVFGKPGDKLLADGFLFAGILHQLQNFGNRGFLTGLCHRHPQQPRQVHAAADDVIAHTDALGAGIRR